MLCTFFHDQKHGNYQLHPAPPCVTAVAAIQKYMNTIEVSVDRLEAETQE